MVIRVECLYFIIFAYFVTFISNDQLHSTDNSESEQSLGSMSGEEDEEDSSLNDEEMMVDEEQDDEDDEDESVGSEDIKTTEEVEEELSALGSFKAKMKSGTDTHQPGQKFR